MKTFLSTFTVAAAIAFGGCASNPALVKPTASGQAEGTFKALSLEDTKNKLIEGCTSKQYQIADVNSNQVTCAKAMTDMQGTMYQALAGNAYSSTPKRKLKFIMYATGADTKVIASTSIEMQGVFGQNQNNEAMPPKLQNELQNFLFSLGAE